MGRWSLSAAIAAITVGIVCITVQMDARAETSASANLIYNHSFERLHDGAVDGWTGSNAGLCTKHAHTGQHSLQVDPSGEMMALGIATLPTFKYTIRGFFQSSEAERSGFLIRYYADDEEAIDEQRIPVPEANDGWQKIEQIVEVPFGAKCMSVGVYNNAETPLFCDDLTATELYQFRPPKTDLPPVIDGSLDDPCWEGASVGDEDWITVHGEVARQQTRVFCCYDDDHLYIAFRLYTCCPHELKAVETRDDFYVWRDESAEVFIDPGHDHASYCELEINSRNVEYDAWSFDRSWECIWEHEVGLEDDAWICEMAIDLASFEQKDAFGEPSGRFPLPSSGVWGINFSRNDSITGESSSWPNSGRSFHNTHRYGHMLAFEPCRSEEYGAEADYRMKHVQRALTPIQYTIEQHSSRDLAESIAANLAEIRPHLESAATKLTRARQKNSLNNDFDQWVDLNTLLTEIENETARLKDEIQPFRARGYWADTLGQTVDMAVSISAEPVEAETCIDTWRAGSSLPIHLGRADIAGFSAVIDSFGSLKNIKASARVETLGEFPVQITRTPGRQDHESYRWPRPEVNLKADQRAVLWIPIVTEEDVLPGQYRGVLQVTADDQPTIKQPFTVRVWDFEVPRSNELQLSVLSPEFSAADITAELAGYGVPAGSVAVWAVPKLNAGEEYSTEAIDRLVAEARAKCHRFKIQRPELSGYLLGVLGPEAGQIKRYERLYTRLAEELPEWPLIQVVNAAQGELQEYERLDEWVDIWALSGSIWDKTELGRTDEADERWLYYELPFTDGKKNRLADARIQPWVAQYIGAAGIVWGDSTKSGISFPMFEMYCRMIALGHRDCDYFNYIDTLIGDELRKKAGNHWRLRSNARLATLLRGFSVLSPTYYHADYIAMQARRIQCGKVIERIHRHLAPLGPAER